MKKRVHRSPLTGRAPASLEAESLAKSLKEGEDNAKVTCVQGTKSQRYRRAGNPHFSQPGIAFYTGTTNGAVGEAAVIYGKAYYTQILTVLDGDGAYRVSSIHLPPLSR